MSQSDLTNANLGFDNVGGRTQLAGANMSDCKFAGANFEGATYDERTIFNIGLNLADHKMVLVGSGRH